MAERKRRLCALVVDDNRDAAETFAGLLGAMGCESAYCTDARSALSEAMRLKPHIAFLDLGMPVVDGYQLARLLRQQFSGEELKLVAVTGHGAPADRAAARKAGFDAHVLKPVDPALVESIIKTVLTED